MVEASGAHDVGRESSAAPAEPVIAEEVTQPAAAEMPPEEETAGWEEARIEAENRIKMIKREIENAPKRKPPLITRDNRDHKPLEKPKAYVPGSIKVKLQNY